jgi:hypothetical protein
MTEEQARKQAKREREFYGHLASYLICSTFFIALNLLTSPDALWFFFPMLGWGIGLASHAVSVFGLPGRGKDWEGRRVRELMGAEGSAERLRLLVDEELDRREPAQRKGAPGQDDDARRLRERIEHLEAIVTSRDWDDLAGGGPIAGAVDDAGEPAQSDNDAERVARLARRVR